MLEQKGKRTFVINDRNKVGIYLVNARDVVIIDTGIDNQSANNIMNICQENNWDISMIINTHSHTDHIGGNYMIQNKLNIPIYAKGIEKSMIEYPEITGAISFGGYPHKFLKNKYLITQKSKVQELSNGVLPDGLEIIDLPGHNQDLIGLKTSDDIYFLSDAIAGENIINKYKIQFIYNIKDYLKSLDYIAALKGELFIPGHGDDFNDPKKIVELNKLAIFEIIDNIKIICKSPKSFDQILKSVFDKYNIHMDIIQHSYISSTIKCYLSYMIDEDIINIEIKDNVMLWITK